MEIIQFFIVSILKKIYKKTFMDIHGMILKQFLKIIFNRNNGGKWGWFQNLNIEYLNEKGRWRRILKPVEITPKFDKTNNFVNKAHYMNYLIQFDEIKTKDKNNGDAGER